MKLIKLPHKVCPMTCMVNGLEDLYEAKTGTRLPDQFLLFMSGMAGFAYLKLSKAPVPQPMSNRVRSPRSGTLRRMTSSISRRRATNQK